MALNSENKPNSQSSSPATSSMSSMQTNCRDCRPSTMPGARLANVGRVAQTGRRFPGATANCLQEMGLANGRRPPQPPTSALNARSTMSLRNATTGLIACGQETFKNSVILELQWQRQLTHGSASASSNSAASSITSAASGWSARYWLIGEARNDRDDSGGR